MPPEHQEKALECYVLTCLNHSIALQSTAYFANESKVLAEALEELDLSSVDSELAIACEHNVDEMSSCETTTVSQLLRAVSKLFASHGDCGSYPLNEYEPLTAWIQKRNKENPHLPPLKLEHLLSFKGSRMHILLDLAESIALNREIYLTYLSTLRAGTKENKLVSVVWKVLSEAPVFNTSLSRAVVWRGLMKPARFLLNHLAERPDCHQIVNCMQTSLEILTAMTENSDADFCNTIKATTSKFSEDVDS